MVARWNRDCQLSSQLCSSRRTVFPWSAASKNEMSIWKLGLDSKFSTLWNVSYAQILGYPYDYFIPLCYDVAQCKISEYMVFFDYSRNRMSGCYGIDYWRGKRKGILVFYPQ